MKKILIIMLLPLMFGCGGKQAEIDRLKAVNDSLMNKDSAKADKIEEYLAAFNEIQENLNIIKEKENLIRNSTNTGSEMQEEQKNRINEDILSIYEIMLQNKQQLENLEKRLGKSNHRLKEFKKMVATLKRQLEEKDAQIDGLKGELAKLNFDIEKLNSEINSMATNIDSLSSENEQKTTEIAKKTEALNTAYYAIGTKKELKENNVITKKGGFAGIGRTAKLDENFDKDYFTKIDIQKVKKINISSKKAKIITTHPKGSYKLIEGDKIETLEITDPDKFWSVSKYLVIIIN